VACFLVVRQVRSWRSGPATVPQIRRYRPDQPWSSGGDSARGGKGWCGRGGARAQGPRVCGPLDLACVRWGRDGGQWRRRRRQGDGVLPGLAETRRDRQEEQVLRWLASGLAAW